MAKLKYLIRNKTRVSVNEKEQIREFKTIEVEPKVFDNFKEAMKYREGLSKEKYSYYLIRYRREHYNVETIVNPYELTEECLIPDKCDPKYEIHLSPEQKMYFKELLEQ